MSKPSVLQLLRPDVPLHTAFSVSPLACQAKLDQNEAPFEIDSSAKERILADLQDTPWNRYPQPVVYARIKEQFAACLGLDPAGLILSAGCDQLILLAYWAAGGPGRQARVFEPTYPMYQHFARTTQTQLDQVVLGADFDVAAHGLGDPAHLLFLVSPNNPHGTGPDRALVAEALDRPWLVMVDEAYADYAGTSVQDLVQKHPNLLVARSLSKALLAGVRLGYGVGHPELIAALERLIFAPYHLSALQLLVARHFELIQPQLAQRVAQVVDQRERVARRLKELGLDVWPSQANFLLFAVPDAAATTERLLQAGVRLRNVSNLPGLDNHLRVTIGLEQENDLFLEALDRAL